MRRIACIVAVVLGATMIAGCGLFTPAFDGTWDGIGDYSIETPGGQMIISQLVATFAAGTYRFDYRIASADESFEPKPIWHSGSVTPAIPVAGGSFEMEVTAKIDEPETPAIGAKFAGTVVYLTRAVMVLELDVNDDEVVDQTFSFARR
ncbi:MAG: hypothetical protein EA382_11155 [Spirochaetaceae bacterium]|nr:MAG: hypothetical protein EA382_11155 [Spirochaetaceae bacterium]